MSEAHKNRTVFDTYQLDKSYIDADGFLIAPVRLCRTGVLTYRKPDGSPMRVLRHPSEVFKKETIDSFKMLPATDGHPPDLLTSLTAATYQRGMTGENVVKEDEIFMGSTIKVTDQMTIEGIKSGNKEVSIGAHVDLVMESGEWEGQPYDAMHVNIRGNHVAVNIPSGRAGEEVRIMDDKFNLIHSKVKDSSQPSGSKKMKKLKIGDTEVDVEDAVYDAMTSLQKQAADLKDELDKVKDAKEKKGEESEVTDEKDKAASVAQKAAAMDALVEKQRAKDDIKKQNAMVAERLTIVDAANKIMDEDELKAFKTAMDSSDNVSLMAAVLTAHDAAFDPKGKSADYLKARFEMVAAGATEKVQDSGEELGGMIIDSAVKGAAGKTVVFDEKKITDEQRQKLSEMHKQPIPGFATKK